VSIDPFNAFLHGEPQSGGDVTTVGVKDVIDVAGMPTTAASKVLHRVPAEDADCVARLRDSGAAIVGKLNTHEFAFGALTNSPHFGPALNPWNPAHSCGGSSGGSGAAVAAGLCDAALGTDTAGSVRIPAAFCGVTGVRPSAGLVSSRGVVSTAWTLDTVGPLAHTAAECGRLLEIMAGRPLPAREGELRIGAVTGLFERAQPEVAAACEAAAAELGRADPVAIPLHDEITTITQLIMLPEAAAAHLPWMRTKLADYGADVRARLLAGLLLPPTAYVTGLRGRNWVRDEWEHALGAYDLIVAPAMPITAPRLDAIPDDYRLLLMPYNSHQALLGLPVAVVPCGLVDGLPVGLSITGRRGEDGTVLAAARAFQQRTDWHELRPRFPVDAAREESYTTSTSEERGA
jgi:aspartyl-tRNA(Asn)/glutamyl-tRNA(Gln) amidotransferase subunit A